MGLNNPEFSGGAEWIVSGLHSLDEIARCEGKSTRNISMMINLAFLAPDIFEAIVKAEALAP